MRERVVGEQARLPRDHVGVEAHEARTAVPACSSFPPAAATGWPRPPPWHRQCRSLLDHLAPIADPESDAAETTRWRGAGRGAAVLAGASPWPRSANGRRTRPGRSWPRWGARDP